MKVSGNLYQDNDRLFILVTSSQTLFTVPACSSILAEDSITCTTTKSYETVYIMRSEIGVTEGQGTLMSKLQQKL